MIYRFDSDKLDELTGEFVADQLAALHIADTGEKRADLILCHALGQVIYNEIRLGLLLRGLSEGGTTILLHDRVHSVRHHCTLLPGPL